MKALQSEEVKFQPASVGDFRKLRVLLDNPTLENEAEKKMLGVPRYHTYLVKSDKPYTEYIRHLHHTTDVENTKQELSSLGHLAINIVNVFKSVNVRGISLNYTSFRSLK